MPFFRQVHWLTVAVCLALVARGLWFEPLPGIWAATALVWLLGLSVAGALVPRWEMFGDVFWCAAPGQEGVALTFDDGPDPVSTRRILKVLADAQVLATFFVIGEKAAAHPDVVREIHAAGHTLGVHGWSHERIYAFKSPRAVQADIARCQKLLIDITGEQVAIFRPPVGQLSPRTAAGTRLAGVTVVGWSISARDGIRTTPEKVLARVGARLASGAIILLHDAAERGGHEPACVAALPALLRLLAARDLRCVPLSDWIGVGPPRPTSPRSAQVPEDLDSGGAAGKVTRNLAPPE